MTRRQPRQNETESDTSPTPPPAVAPLVETQPETRTHVDPPAPESIVPEGGTKAEAGDTKTPVPRTSQIPNPRSPIPPLAVAPFDTTKAKEYQAAWAKYRNVPAEITNAIGMKFVLIPPGEFMMGSPNEVIEEELKTPGIEGWYRDSMAGEGPQHRVRITKPFYLGMYVVTQEEYQQVMGNNPSEFRAGGKFRGRVNGQDTKRFPVEHVRWDDAVEFCRRLSELPVERATKRQYGLPTEAQWEYACRVGSRGRFCCSSDRGDIPKEAAERDLSNYGWFNNNSGGRTHAAGERPANAWGLYDMHGNVWEWCQDCYDAGYYSRSPMDDPTGPPAGRGHVTRGGSWFDPPERCRSACRFNRWPWLGDCFFNLGFRVSLVLTPNKGDGAENAPPPDTKADNGGEENSQEVKPSKGDNKAKAVIGGIFQVSMREQKSNKAITRFWNFHPDNSVSDKYNRIATWTAKGHQIHIEFSDKSLHPLVILRKGNGAFAGTYKYQNRETWSYELQLIFIVAVWQHQAAGDQPRNVAFWSNGHLESPDGNATWEINGSNLKLHWPPWTDNCTISPDGQSTRERTRGEEM